MERRQGGEDEACTDISKAPGALLSHVLHGVPEALHEERYGPTLHHDSGMIGRCDVREGPGCLVLVFWVWASVAKRVRRVRGSEDTGSEGRIDGRATRRSNHGTRGA